MDYYKNIYGGNIDSISIGAGLTAITEEEYNKIKNLIDSRPTPPEGYRCVLRESMEWANETIPQELYNDESLTVQGENEV